MLLLGIGEEPVVLPVGAQIAREAPEVRVSGEGYRSPDVVERL